MTLARYSALEIVGFIIIIIKHSISLIFLFYMSPFSPLSYFLFKLKGLYVHIWPVPSGLSCCLQYSTIVILSVLRVGYTIMVSVITVTF